LRTYDQREAREDANEVLLSGARWPVTAFHYTKYPNGLGARTRFWAAPVAANPLVCNNRVSIPGIIVAQVAFREPVH